MKRRIAVLLLLVGPILFGAERLPFVYPKETVTSENRGTSGTWKAGGTVALAQDVCEKAFMMSLKTAGYTFLHRIPLGKDQVLLAWKKERMSLIMLLRRRSDAVTEFMWGESVL